MEGGLGAESYARNSATQWSAFSLIVPAIRDAIAAADKLASSRGSSTIRVADLGCSSGVNTINAVDVIVGAFKDKFRLTGLPEPEFQAFFSDLSSNDFDTLFLLLFQREALLSYFVAGVPGSFYDRLFPSSSIHFAMSNVALHWMSKVPDAVLDRKSVCWSSRVLANKASHGFVQAFEQQAHEDLCRFLQLRADELVPGGLLSLFMNGRNSEDPSLQGDDETDFIEWSSSRMELALQDLVIEGMIDEETRDSFKLPAFHRAEKDMIKAVEATGNFTILRLETIDFRMPAYGDARAKAAAAGIEAPSPQEYARREATKTASVLKKIVEKHFNNDNVLVEKLFQRLEQQYLPKEPYVCSLEACR